MFALQSIRTLALSASCVLCTGCLGPEPFSPLDDSPRCGDGKAQPPEQCDGGEDCRPDCMRAECGDGVVDVGDVCFHDVVRYPGGGRKPYIVDLNGDSFLDVVTAGPVETRLGLDGGTFEMTSTNVSGFEGAIAVGDFDYDGGDGQIDVALGDTPGLLLYGQATAPYFDTAAPQQLDFPPGNHRLAAVNLVNQGHDLVRGDDGPAATKTLDLFFSLPNRMFSKTSYPTEGVLDLEPIQRGVLALEDDNTLRVRKHISDGNLDASVTTALSGLEQPSLMTAIDSRVAIADVALNRVFTFLSDSSGVYSQQASFDTDGTATAIQYAELSNGADGLVYASSSGLYWVQRTGEAYFAPKRLIEDPVEDFAIADINGDGALDIVATLATRGLAVALSNP